MPVEVLTDRQCRRLLELHDIGRLAVIASEYPVVFPVNYTFTHDRVLIRSDPGTKLTHAQFERICFEVDDLDRSTRTGWSVLVKGVLHELRPGDHHDDELRRTAEGIASWTGGGLAHVLVITPVSVTGRRITGL